MADEFKNHREESIKRLINDQTKNHVTKKEYDALVVEIDALKERISKLESK